HRSGDHGTIQPLPTRRSSDLMGGTEINIEILPPLWLSLPAKTVYVMLTLIAAWLVVRWYRARNKRTQRRELDRVRLEEEQKSFRSEEHTSELQSRENIVCRLL